MHTIHERPSTVPLGDAHSEWQQLLERIPLELRRQVGELVAQHKTALTDRFYVLMETHPLAREFLDHDAVDRRLRASMCTWLSQLFDVGEHVTVGSAVQRQFQIGEVHARIKLPMHLVLLGIRQHKLAIIELLSTLSLDRDRLMLATDYVHRLLDLTGQLMSLAYPGELGQSDRGEEAYRIHALSQNISVDKERQRAELLEWCSSLACDLLTDRIPHLRPLGRSQFGLWLKHRAPGMFAGSQELIKIEECRRRIDQQLLPRLVDQGATSRASLIDELHAEVDTIKFLLTAVFERHLEIENGRDALTRLLSRRFLPTILQREIEVAKRSGQDFALVLLDIDHFKQINDKHGHEAGDLVLQQISERLTAHLRGGDFVFRYGGEEILVVLVEITETNALRVAESIRKSMSAEAFVIANNDRLNLTVSIGIAMYDGHPDYQRLIRRADSALYRAKNSGRDRCVVWQEGTDSATPAGRAASALAEG